MTTALIIFLNVFFIAFVLVTVVGLQLYGIFSDRTSRPSAAGQGARVRGASPFQRRPGTTAARARRTGRALDLGA
ncbi:MAG TPA: hypothetical protein VMA77_11610 [Solirubrobacteraceae bacterium]|nr:hypothetical protein [Solirubrobacteraceae bacterium]